MDSDSTSLERLLTDLFTLKFTNKGEDLITAIESFNWKPFSEIKPQDIFAYLKEMREKPTPKGKIAKKVSVEFPIKKNGELIFSVDALKASACFPWELDPVDHRTWLRVSDLKHVVIQLAQASHYGSDRAAKDIRAIARQSMKLDTKHYLWKDKRCPKSQTYKFPILFDELPKEDREGACHFSEMEEEEFTELFDKFYKVERVGLFKADEDSEEEDSIDPKIYKIFIVGERSKDEKLWEIINRNLIEKTKSFDKVSGTYEIRDKVRTLEFYMMNTIPKDGKENPEAIIFTDHQNDPEGIAESLEEALEVRSFLFYGTPEPNPSKAKSTNWYLNNEDEDEQYDQEEDDELFEKFVDDMID